MTVRVGFLLQKITGQEHLAEDRSCFRKGKRGVIVEHGLTAGKDEMETVPQLVGKGGHVAQVAGEIQQHIGRKRGGHPHAKGPATLAGSGENVDPALV